MMLESNERQRMIIMHIYKCFKEETSLPLNIFIRGSAGVGKSEVIQTLYQLLNLYFDSVPGPQSDKEKIILSAYTGKAVYLIGGTTLHTAFALPVDQYGGQFVDLGAEIANNIREELHDVKLLIIDEISMVSSKLLSMIDTRLRQIRGIDKNFGNLSVIIVGIIYTN